MSLSLMLLAHRLTDLTVSDVHVCFGHLIAFIEFALGMLSMLRGKTIVDVVTGDWLADVRSRKSLFQSLICHAALRNIKNLLTDP